MVNIQCYAIVFNANAYTRLSWQTENNYQQKRRFTLQLEGKMSLPAWQKDVSQFYFDLDLYQTYPSTFSSDHPFEGIAQLHEAKASWLFKHWKWDLGLQKISWVENSGVNPIDLLLPKDYRAFVFGSLREQQLPFLGCYGSGIYNNFNLNILIIPRATYPISPVKLNRDVAHPTFLPDPLHETEAGLRLGYLFYGGFNLQIAYLSHFNRNLTYGLLPSGHLSLAYDRVNSFFVSMSQAFDSFVLKHDFWYGNNSLYNEPRSQALLKGDEIRWILGLEYNALTDLNFGIQYQGHVRTLPMDRYTYEHAFFAFTKWSFWKRIFELSMNAWSTHEGKDYWWQGVFTWQPLSYLAAMIKYDVIHGSTADKLLGFDKQDLLTTELHYYF